jgi:hypothetical protein
MKRKSTGLVRTLVFMRLFAFLGALCPKMGFAQMVPSLDWTEANTIVEAGVMGSKMGSRVSGAGDINGDGYSDIVIAADDYEDPVAGKGGIFIFHGSPDGIKSGNRVTKLNVQ